MYLNTDLTQTWQALLAPSIMSSLLIMNVPLGNVWHCPLRQELDAKDDFQARLASKGVLELQATFARNFRVHGRIVGSTDTLPN